MKDKEKQIEELARELLNACAWRFGRPSDYKELFNDIAEYLAEQGYRKIDKDSVVLSREEYEKLKYTWITDSDAYKKGSKETAEKIRTFLRNKLCYEDTINEYVVTENDIDECSKQFGVEIKE